MLLQCDSTDMDNSITEGNEAHKSCCYQLGLRWQQQLHEKVQNELRQTFNQAYYRQNE